MSKQIATVGLVAGSIIWASAAGAATITIGSSFNGGSISTRSSGSNSATASFNAGGGWQSNLITGLSPTGVLDIFNSNSQNGTNGGSNNVQDIFVTASGLTSPTGSVPLISTFTSNTLPTGWTVTESTFLNTDNAVFGVETLLGSETFTGPITTGSTGSATMLASLPTTPYSLTTEYVINSGGVSGAANSTIDIAAAPPPIPLPGALPLFASGLVCFWGWTRRRKKLAA